MREINRIVIPKKENQPYFWPPKSLYWYGDVLIDLVGGIVQYKLDQTITSPRVSYSYRFDHAVVSPAGDFVALIERLGTKGLILKNGQVIREINRSFYHADRYEYPITFLTLPNGRTGLAHCPDAYNKLDIEDAETGECFTKRENKSMDFFHSHLSVSSDSRYLLSAGWVWQPLEFAALYEIERCLKDPELLDRGNKNSTLDSVSINAAVFYGQSSIFFTTTEDYYEPDEIEPNEDWLLPSNMIAKYDLLEGRIVKKAPLQERAGLLFPIDDRYVLGTYEHLKLFDLETGAVVIRWEDLLTSQQLSCIVTASSLLPPLAVDPENKRFAIASEDEVTVIQLTTP